MVHGAGTPCVAFSSMGLCDGESSKSWVHFLIWASMRLILQEPIIFQENVANFPRHVLLTLLPMYEFVFDIITPDRHGWPIRRHRQWIVYRAQLWLAG